MRRARGWAFAPRARRCTRWCSMSTLLRLVVVALGIGAGALAGCGSVSGGSGVDATGAGGSAGKGGVGDGAASRGQAGASRVRAASARTPTRATCRGRFRRDGRGHAEVHREDERGTDGRRGRHQRRAQRVHRALQHLPRPRVQPGWLQPGLSFRHGDDRQPAGVLHDRDDRGRQAVLRLRQQWLRRKRGHPLHRRGLRRTAPWRCARPTETSSTRSAGERRRTRSSRRHPRRRPCPGRRSRGCPTATTATTTRTTS